MGLLAYSGITTKVRAMESRLFTEEQLRELASAASVSEALELLKQNPSYGDLFHGLEAAELHRADIEQRLIQSKYRDFTKLYRFSSQSQRKFLDLYFLHFEIAIFKWCLRAILDHRQADLDLSQFQDFFKRHSHLDLNQMSACQSLPEFLACLEGTPFYGLLSGLSETPEATLFDYELKLDLFYFKTMWKASGKLSDQETAILTQCFGSKLDILNIQWIYRSLRYYHLTPAQIYALLIPIRYKLRQNDIQNMAESDTMEDFFSPFWKASATALEQRPSVPLLSNETKRRK